MAIFFVIVNKSEWWDPSENVVNGLINMWLFLIQWSIRCWQENKNYTELKICLKINGGKT